MKPRFSGPSRTSGPATATIDWMRSLFTIHETPNAMTAIDSADKVTHDSASSFDAST